MSAVDLASTSTSTSAGPMSLMSDAWLSSALGCLYGNFCGDAAGAVLEFMRCKISEEMVTEAMEMPGRKNKLSYNLAKVGSGQITDDGELTLALLHGAYQHYKTITMTATAAVVDQQPTLAEINEYYTRSSSSSSSSSSSCDWPSLEASDAELIESIAKQYEAWYHSDPFDCGDTTRRAFSATNFIRTAQAKDAAAETVSQPKEQQGQQQQQQETPALLRVSDCFSRAAAERNSRSYANGSLMRCNGLAVILGPRPPIARVRALTSAESRLSHPRLECQLAEFYYCLALNHLIFNPGDSTGALQLVETEARNRKRRLSTSGAGQGSQSTKEEELVADWLLVESLDASGIKCHIVDIGFVKWGFILAFYHLRLGSTFESAIRATLLKGGDTDTNAAIVGAIIGARWGIEKIPRYMLDPVCLAAEPRIDRPDWLIPKRERVELEVQLLLCWCSG